MTRSRSVLVALVLIVAAVGGAATSAAGVAPDASVDAQTTTDASQQESAQSELAPGERLAGIVSVQEAELEGEIETRTFDVTVDRADTNTSKAEILADRLEAIRERLRSLQGRLEQLENARQNGDISEREYRRQVARIAAELGTIERLADRIEGNSAKLPLRLLVASGVNVTATYTLQTDAENLSRSEARDVARSVAGPDIGKDFDRRNAQMRAKAAIKHAERAVRQAGELIEQANETAVDDRRASRALSQAKRHVHRAEVSLDRAHDAYEAGRYERAYAHAKAANRGVRSAIRHAHRAKTASRHTDRLEDRAQTAIEHAERTTQKAHEAVERAEEAVADDDRKAQAVLHRATENLHTAGTELEQARRAFRADEYERTIRHALVATKRAELATREAHAAVRIANQGSDSGSDEFDERAEAAVGDAADRVETAHEAIGRANDVITDDDRKARALLNRAEDRFDRADRAVTEARSALENDDPRRALKLAEQAKANARAAIEYAKQAINAAESGGSDEETPERDSDDEDESGTPTDRDTDSESRDR